MNKFLFDHVKKITILKYRGFYYNMKSGEIISPVFTNLSTCRPLKREFITKKEKIDKNILNNYINSNLKIRTMGKNKEIFFFPDLNISFYIYNTKGNYQIQICGKYPIYVLRTFLKLLHRL